MVNPDEHKEAVARMIDNRRDLFLERLEELTSLGFLSLDGHKLPEKHTHYLYEATNDYIFYSPISCIICCAAIVEQIFKAFYIESASNDTEKEERELQFQNKRPMTFGLLIDKCEKVPSLKPFINDAKWLNEIRRSLAAHTPYIPHIIPSTANEKDRKRYSGYLWRELDVIMKCLDPKEDSDLIQCIKLDPAVTYGGKEIPLIDIMRNPLEEVNYDMVSDKIYAKIITPLALKAWKRMKKILEVLCGSHKRKK